jgi:hypothetical protein
MTTTPDSVSAAPSAADVLDRELANTRRASVTTAAAIVAASNGLLHLVATVQLWSAVWLLGLYRYIPWAMIAIAIGLFVLASRLYGQRVGAVVGGIVLGVIDALGMGAWMFLAFTGGFASLLLLLLPVASIATVILCGFAYGPCARTAEARKRAAAAGVDIDLRT